MKTVTHICDLCKKSKSEEDLAKISVTTRGITLSRNHFHPAAEFDICSDCLKAKGFMVNPKTEEEISQAGANNEKTLKNKLIDILEDLDVQFYE